MSSTLGNQYVGAVGPNGIQVWVPTPYPLGSAQAQGSVKGASTGSTGTGGGTTTPTDGSGNVQAQALFYAATCLATDAIGAFVRADAGQNAVTTATCFAPYPAIGCIVSKSSATACVVQTYGLCRSIYGSLTANSRYLIGPTGQPILASQMPGNAPYVQAIGFAVQATALFVQPSGIIYRRDVGTPTDNTSTGDTVTNFYGGLLNGEGPPADDYGNQNDSYIQTVGPNGPVLWGPKPSPTSWGNTSVALVGPPGARGSQFFHGPGVPTNDMGQQANDVYFQETDDDVVFYKAS